jgi:tetratricopeptide (TPR) repeat protein
MEGDPDTCARLTSELISELTTMGKLLRLLQRPDEALPRYEEALKLSERHRIGSWEHHAMRSIIGELKLKQDPSKARKTLLESYQKLADARIQSAPVPVVVLQAASARVADHCSSDTSTRPQALGLLDRMETQFSKRCYWPEARDAAERFLQIDPQNSGMSHRLIPVLAWMKDIEAWKKANIHAAENRRAKGLWEHLLKDALMLPDASVPLSLLREENERARSENRYDYGYGWDPLAEALRFYREGNVHAALEKAVKLRSAWRLEPVEMQSHALLMMCEHRLGIGTMTREERLASIDQQRQRLPPMEPGDVISEAHSHDQITSVILLEEARRLVLAEPDLVGGKKP